MKLMTEQKQAINSVGLFTDSFTPMVDGVATVVESSAFQMYLRNIQVCVVAPSCGHAKREPFDVLRYPSFLFSTRRQYRSNLPFAERYIANQLKNRRLEIVHAHSPFFSGKVALKFAKEHKIPLVATFHSKFKDNLKQIIPSEFIVNQAIKTIIRFFEQADEVWIPQASVEQTMREYGYRGKVEVVENGCYYVPPADIASLKAEVRKKLGILSEETVYLFVGQHIYEKNVKLILDSLAKIDKQTYRMLFVGTGYAEKDFRKLACELNIDDRVEFVGLISDRRQLAEYYVAADLFLFPSLYDTSAIVMKEAAAFATPSVVIKNSTIAENIIDNRNGFLTENSVSSFAEKLILLQKDKNKVAQAGLAAQASLTRSWADITDELTERYASLIARNA
ncbi:MAG: glycosyltransferase [Prevotellaceae bacterium]|jgi:glycosyltransferase involved in cell wall biosynthesis|nr:glycosyltransferase [Prevotellaceae bacterium]